MNHYHATPDLARDDVAAIGRLDLATGPDPEVRRTGRWWALAGLAAGVLAPFGILYVDAAGNPAYDRVIAGDPTAYLGRLASITGAMTVFHVTVTIAALLLVVFAAGLHRRLRQALPSSSLLPALASAGLVLTAGITLMGTGLDTEVTFGVAHANIDAGTAVLYSHWIGTITYVWVAAGLTGLVLAVAAFRHRALPRWIGVVGLVLGGLTAALGVSPLQYLAGMTGWLWLVVTGLGLAVGDKVHRQA